MPHPHLSDNQESDPLQAFLEEPHAAPAGQPAESAKVVEPAAKPADPATTPRGEDPNAELRRRLQHTERQVDRALIDLATLKTDLATLVGAVDDIKKRTNRPPAGPAPVVEPRRRRLSGPRAIAAIVILLTAGAALWGFAWVAADDFPEPPRLERETASVGPQVGEPPPMVEASPAPVLVQAGQPPAAAESSSSARPMRTAPYVGTLTVDAEPAGDVYLNRKGVGRTPVRLENLRAGSHLIWIERDGYRRWTRVVAVAADRISRVSASLDPLSR